MSRLLLLLAFIVVVVVVEGSTARGPIGFAAVMDDDRDDGFTVCNRPDDCADGGIVDFK